MSKKPDDYIGWFDEAHNHRSSSRLMAFLMFLAASGFGTYSLIKPEVSSTGVQLCVTFLTASVGTKSLGKFAEKEQI